MSETQKKYRSENKIRRREIEAASHIKHLPANRYGDALRRSRKKKVPICGKPEFIEWIKAQALECVYCSSTESEAIMRYGHRLHVDRKENALGYVPGNMQLACQRCNATKNAYLTHDQMREIAQKYFV